MTGKAIYANDIRMATWCSARWCAPPSPAARILSIDTAEAEKVPGVVRIFTAKDIPGIPNQPCDRPVICGDRVRYIGDAVALVAARPESRPTRPPGW